MSSDDALRPQTVRHTLARRAGEGATAEAIAEAAVSTWGRVAVVLAPIIGEGGVGSLYARSVHLTRFNFPWLAASQLMPPPSWVQQTDWPYMDLRMSLAQRGPAEASKASSALLDTFLELLSTLIGEPLTARLLRSLLDDAGPHGPAQEIKQ
ncbi:MAG: hypothetical protein H7X91_06070 [Burkholderiales bacterium]|nr:hypothetical protein [Burkholderiales bacterium]